GYVARATWISRAPHASAQETATSTPCSSSAGAFGRTTSAEVIEITTVAISRTGSGHQWADPSGGTSAVATIGVGPAQATPAKALHSATPLYRIEAGNRSEVRLDTTA